MRYTEARMRKILKIMADIEKKHWFSIELLILCMNQSNANPRSNLC
jgi:hypothetical protein